MAIRHETIAQIWVPLSENGDIYRDYGSNIWINLIGEFHGNKKVPKRTMARINIKLSDGTIFSGPLRKNDLEGFHRVSKLFYASSRSINRSKTNLKILNEKLVQFMKSLQKSDKKTKKNKGAKK